MKSSNPLLYKGLTVILAACLLWGSSGCFGPKTVEKAAIAPVFFPPPPDQPRLQFLASYSGAEDFGGGPKASFLETFLLGPPELRPERILKPYGLAIHEGKIYVCDITQKQIKVLDLRKNKFSTFDSGRSLQSPINIFIEADGTKYIADSLGGAVFVYNNEDKLISFLGKDLQIKPTDVAVRGSSVYIADANSNQVLVLDKTSGKLLNRIGGKQDTDETEQAPDKSFAMITGVGLDQHGNIYVSDKLTSRVSRFDVSGEHVRNYGRYGSAPGSLVRAKGVAIDREDRIWVVDAGPAQAVKVYRGHDGQSLMIVGARVSKEPGYMYMPAAVRIDYDNVDLFRKYAVDGAELEFLVIVTNQFGPNKVTVYGFGKFPQMARPPKPKELQTDTDTEPK